jgi:hypothetical protein
MNGMDVNEWISSIIGAIAVVAAGLLGIWSTRQDKARDEINEHLRASDKAIYACENRLTVIEEGIRHLPTAASNDIAFEKINIKLDDVKDKIGELKGAQELATALAENIGLKAVGPSRRRAK